MSCSLSLFANGSLKEQNKEPISTHTHYGQLIFDKGARNTQRRRIISSISGLEKYIHIHARVKLDPILTLYMKINIKYIKELNIWSKSIEFIEENMGKAS
jgi:hypothetical protein